MSHSLETISLQEKHPDHWERALLEQGDFEFDSAHVRVEQLSQNKISLVDKHTGAESLVEFSPEGSVVWSLVTIPDKNQEQEIVKKLLTELRGNSDWTESRRNKGDIYAVFEWCGEKGHENRFIEQQINILDEDLRLAA